MNKINQSFADNLKSELNYYGYKFKDFSKEIGIPYSTFLTYVNKCIPRADIAVKIAKKLNTSVEYLITGKELDSSKLIKHYPITSELKFIHPKIQTLLNELIHALSENEIKEFNNE